MKSPLNPVTALAIVVLVIGAFWLRRQVAKEGPVPPPPPPPVVATIPPTEPYTVVDRSHPGQVASPAGKRSMTPSELKLHRDELRTRLIGLMTEAEELARKGEADVAAGRPNASLPRLNEILDALKPIAADTVFADVKTAATNAIDAMAVNQSARIAVALRDAKGLPPP